MGEVEFAVVEDWKWGKALVVSVVWFTRRCDASISNKRYDMEEGTGCACG